MVTCVQSGPARSFGASDDWRAQALHGAPSRLGSGNAAVRLHLTRDGRRRPAEPSGDSTERLTDRQPTAHLLTIREREARTGPATTRSGWTPACRERARHTSRSSTSTRSPLRSRGSSSLLVGVFARAHVAAASGAVPRKPPGRVNSQSSTRRARLPRIP